MSSTTVRGRSSRRETTEPSRVEEPHNTTNSLESRDQFYRDYRDAVRAMRRGDPQRFIAYQSDPRIKPCPESLKLPARPITQESLTGSQRAAVSVMADGQFSIISVLSSVRDMVTVLGKFLS